jgi:hypothetical protein
MSDSNDVSVYYVAETVYNTTPTNSTDWKEVRFTGESLTATTNREDSGEIRSDRQITSSSKTSRQVSGGFNFELSTGTFDDLLEATLGGTWTADVLEVGTTKRSFSIEKDFGSDVSRFETMTGMRVGQLDLNIAANSLLTGSFTFMGAGETVGATSAVGTGSITPATTNDVLNATSDIGTITIDGSSTGICVSSLSVSINNNLREINCVGKEFADNIGWGSSAITGSIETYLTTEMFDNLQKVADNDDVAITFPISDGAGNSYTILLPRVKLSADSPQAGSKDADVMISFTFTALLDGVEGTSMRITRVVAP